MGSPESPAARLCRARAQGFDRLAATLPDITRLELYVEPFNEPSWRAAESAGYRREGLLLQRWQIIDERPRDMYMYAKIA